MPARDAQIRSRRASYTGRLAIRPLTPF